jgi:hypothetical protein
LTRMLMARTMRNRVASVNVRLRIGATRGRVRSHDG